MFLPSPISNDSRRKEKWFEICKYGQISPGVVMNRRNTANVLPVAFSRSFFFFRGYEARNGQPGTSRAEKPHALVCFSHLRTSYLHLIRHLHASISSHSGKCFGHYSLFGSTDLHLRLRQNLFNPSSRYIHGSLHDRPIHSSSVPAHGSVEQEPRGSDTFVGSTPLRSVGSRPCWNR